MGKTASRAEVTAFLKRVKPLVASRLHFATRSKNIYSLTDGGLTINVVKEEIAALTYRNYVSGPEQDEFWGLASDVWVFGTVIDTNEFYLKLKIEEDVGVAPLLICLSFHKAERPLHYPHGRERTELS